MRPPFTHCDLETPAMTQEMQASIREMVKAGVQEELLEQKGLLYRLHELQFREPEPVSES